MKTSSVTHLKNTLSARLKEVVAGETLLITDRHKPIAILQPLRDVQASARLASLFEQGILAPPTRKLNMAAFLKTPRGRCTKPLTEAIKEERENR